MERWETADLLEEAFKVCSTGLRGFGTFIGIEPRDAARIRLLLVLVFREATPGACLDDAVSCAILLDDAYTPDGSLAAGGGLGEWLGTGDALGSGALSRATLRQK
mmetsp:Transcript_33357/g.54107  ORF Transcript_33357/g.54107 Transcript_33357/m.54107 type:complete len:105 (-) Transcript_33357:791-1105(-)